MRFDIQPYVGALPILFGMHRDEVQRLIGPPESKSTIWDGRGTCEYYAQSQYNVGYDNAGLVTHLGFGPGVAELRILGRVLWSVDDQPDPNVLLLSLDSEPLELFGTWIYLKIGVTTTGYHDDYHEHEALTVFPRETHSKLLSDARPADTSKYR